MNLFESMRRQNADLYTANPVNLLTEDQLAQVAQQEGLSVDELRRQLTTPHVDMSCPLCGRASTHVVQCKGCGGGAWGYEFEEMYGRAIKQRLRTRLAQVLADVGTPEQIAAACKHAYQFGGCLVCADCWHHTLPWDAYATCPLNLLAERKLNQRRPDFVWMVGETNYAQWSQRVQAHWLEHWNTVEQKSEVAAWRGAILDGALAEPKQKGADHE